MCGKKHWVIMKGVPVDIFPADVLEKKAIEETMETEYEGVKTKGSSPNQLVRIWEGKREGNK